MNHIDLDGQVADLTGGAQGIGLAIARRLVQLDAGISLWGRNAEALRGAVSTLGASLTNSSPEFVDYMLSRIPRGRFLEVKEAASMMTWLASKENSFTTGAVFDGSGHTLGGKGRSR